MCTDTRAGMLSGMCTGMSRTCARTCAQTCARTCAWHGHIIHGHMARAWTCARTFVACACARARAWTCAQAHARTCARTCEPACARPCEPACAQACVRACAQTCVHVCARMHEKSVRTCVRTCTRMCVQACSQTCVQTCVQTCGPPSPSLLELSRLVRKQGSISAPYRLCIGIISARYRLHIDSMSVPFLLHARLHIGSISGRRLATYHVSQHYSAINFWFLEHLNFVTFQSITP